MNQDITYTLMQDLAADVNYVCGAGMIGFSPSRLDAGTCTNAKTAGADTITVDKIDRMLREMDAALAFPFEPVRQLPDDAYLDFIKYGFGILHQPAPRFTFVAECPSATQSDMPGITKAAALPKKPAPAKVEPSKHKPALAGFDAISGFDHRPGGWGAV